jgi:serine/threonine protein kinase
MTRASQPNDPDPVRSAIRTRHPEIAAEIEGAINTLRKLKEFATPEMLPRPAIPEPDAGHATIALTQALSPLSPTPLEGQTQALLKTEAEPLTGGEMPVLAASSSFGRYQIVRLLGKGAMGAVYLAYDTQLHRHVAIKTPFLGQSALTIERFYREARAAAQLRSPYLCPIYDVGMTAGLHYLSMAFIDGLPLTRVIADGRLKLISQITDIVSKVARGLQKAHEAGIIHRDLKPDNIMIDQDGEPIVMDFGLARRIDDDVQVTMAGVILGTPAFMSPEQVDGNPKLIGPPTDIYSLGVILYYMLTGRLPFKGSLTSILNQIGTKQPPKPSSINAEIGEGSPLEQICMRMIAKSPSGRFASMIEVAMAIEKLSEQPDTPITRPSVLGRLKSWSTGVFSTRARSAHANRNGGELLSEDSPPDAGAATLADS